MFDGMLFGDSVTLYSKICEIGGKASYEKILLDGVYFSECRRKDRKENDSLSSAAVFIPGTSDVGVTVKPGDIFVYGVSEADEPKGEFYTVSEVTFKRSSVPYLGYIKAVCY